MDNLTRLRPVWNIWTFLGLALVALNGWILSTTGGEHGAIWLVAMMLFALSFIVDWKLAPVKVASNGS